jgi:hypothetical protein
MAIKQVETEKRFKSTLKDFYSIWRNETYKKYPSRRDFARKISNSPWYFFTFYSNTAT